MVVTNVNSNYVILLKFWVDIHLWGKKAQSFRTPCILSSLFCVTVHA